MQPDHKFTMSAEAPAQLTFSISVFSMAFATLAY
jgi:hypothetical protein